MKNEIYHDKKWLTFSNLLTFIRIFLTPVLVVGIFYQKWIFTFSLLLFVSITDALDGYLARLLKEETNLGRLLDPVADKILLTSLFFALSFSSPSFYVPFWFVAFIFLRELILIIGSIFVLKLKKGFEIVPSIWGKLTTLFQLLFVFWLFACYFFSWVPQITFNIVLILLFIFSMLSIFFYVKKGIVYLQK